MRRPLYFSAGKMGGSRFGLEVTPEMDLTTNEMAVAEWTYTHGEPAGAGTQTLPSIKVFFIPMKSLEETIGVIGIQYDFKNLLLDQRRLLGVVSNLSALAAARWVKIMVCHVTDRIENVVIPLRDDRLIPRWEKDLL